MTDESRLHPRVCGFFDIVRDPDGVRRMETYVRGIPLLRFVLTNKGTAFTHEERRELALEGLLPPTYNTLGEQLVRAYEGFQRQQSDILAYQYLRNLQDRQEILFYALVAEYLDEMLPIVYTPTVGDAVQEFSHLFEHPRGLSLSRHSIGRALEIVDEYPLHDVRLIVATDSSAILGIGDQGYGGLAISIGKLALYTVGGGVSPFHTMPVSLDVGTDSGEHLNDPLYLGARHPRIRGEEYLAFLDRFVDAIQARWPHAVIQWEDLAKDAAFSVLERYRDRIPSFNDDIQGTGAVTLAGVLAACAQKGESIADQRVLIYGAGAGGIGVAWAIREGMMRAGLTKEEATRRLFVLDSRGLLVSDRKMDSYKLDFAQSPDTIADWTFDGAAPGLSETVRNGQVGVLIGLSGQPNSFTQELVEVVSANSERPLIFPLSNPTKLAEIHPAAAIRWTDSRALVASGSPFRPVSHDGQEYPIGQGNNAFIFPGLGMGAILAEATKVTDGMVLEAAYALADYTQERYGGTGLVYPPVAQLNDVSRYVAARVVRRAQQDGVSTSKIVPEGDLSAFVDDHFWRPDYLPVRYREAGVGHPAPPE